MDACRVKRWGAFRISGTLFGGAFENVLPKGSWENFKKGMDRIFVPLKNIQYIIFSINLEKEAHMENQ